MAVYESPGNQKKLIVDIFNTPVNAGSNLFTNDISVYQDTEKIRATIAVDSNAKFDIQDTLSGTTVSYTLNNGNALNASVYDTFDIEADSSHSYNFQLQTACTVLMCRVFTLGGLTP